MPLGEIKTGQRAILFDFRRALPATRRIHHRGHEFQVVGTEDEIEVGEAPEKRVSDLLGDAAPHPEDSTRGGLLPVSKRSEIAVETVLGFLPDRTGVDDQETRFVSGFRVQPARVMEQVGQLVRIVDIHLATVRSDVKALSGSHCHLLGPRQSESSRVCSTRPPADATRPAFPGCLARAVEPKAARKLNLKV